MLTCLAILINRQKIGRQILCSIIDLSLFDTSKPLDAPAGFLEDLLSIFLGPATSQRSLSLDEGTVISGLREALSVGTGSAVGLIGAQNGYFGNGAIRIPLPEDIRLTCEVLRKAGLGSEVDAFVLSMNRAAERAAPRAKAVFIGAVREMTFQDATRILNGPDTAATDYFRTKTSSSLAQAFRPEISSSMDAVGVTRQYKALNEKYLSLLPLANRESLDLDRYVTDKALEGLFYMVGQEERKIRNDPAARTTELLRKVFGKSSR